MMHIIFHEEAEPDLLNIISYYEKVAPRSVDGVLEDIFRAVAILENFPQAGPSLIQGPFRRIVSVKYHFKIAYQILDTEIKVIGITRYEARNF